MRALVWKEWRENILWAVLVMLALGGAEYYGLHYSQYGMDLYFNEGVTLLRRPFLMVTTFGCALAGLLLGFLQVLPELKRDRWAALLHRPVPRGRFFWGKALAGLALYGVAAALPFLFCVWHVARPGNFAAPFLPIMIQPSLADLATGLAYYFAALVFALQSGSLFLRSLPLLAALHVSFFSLHESLFRVAVEAALAMAVALAVAGWGAIHARDTLRGRPWLGSIAFLIVAFYGVCGAGDLLKWAAELVSPSGYGEYSNWRVLDDGTPAKLRFVDDVLVSLTRADGQTPTEPRYHLDRVQNAMMGMNQASQYIGDAHGWKPQPNRLWYRESYSYLSPGQPYFHPRSEQWFQICGPSLFEQAYFIGVLPQERRVFAQLGAEGFVGPEAPAKPFPKGTLTQASGGEKLFISSPDGLRLADMVKREIVPLALPVPPPIYGMSFAWVRTQSGSFNFKGVALGTAMAVYDGSGKLVATLPYHHDVDRWGRISLGVMSSRDRFVLRYDPSLWIPEKTRRPMPIYIDQMDAQGNVLVSQTLPAEPRPVHRATWSGIVEEHVPSPAFFFGEMLYQRIGAACGSVRLGNALHTALTTNRKDTIEIGRFILLAALGLAGITWFWARRGQLPPRRQWAWTAGVFLFGLPGFVLFWLAGERPCTVPCPACTRPRRIEKEECAHCGAGWPAPSADDTQIIEPGSRPAPVTASAA